MLILVIKVMATLPLIAKNAVIVSSDVSGVQFLFKGSALKFKSDSLKNK